MATEHARPLEGGTHDTIPDVVAYLRSRGLARSEDLGSILTQLLELPVRERSGRVSVTRAARAMYLSRRSLARLCERGGLPPPSHILVFGRILATLRAMRTRGWPVGRAAATTGWPDPFSFSNATHRVTGLRPSLARAKGLIFVAEAWIQKELEKGTLTLTDPEAPPCPACGHRLMGPPIPTSPAP